MILRRTVKVCRPFLRRGFRVTLINNKNSSHPYEFVVEAVSQSAKALTKRILWKYKSFTINDYSSSLTINHAKYRALGKVNELCSPFWFKK